MHTNDPVRSIPFFRRYQTHNGNGIALGIDTIDPVSAFSDLLSGSRGTLAQSDDGKKPTLVFQSGIPFLRFDGADDFLSESFTLAQPNTVILAFRNRAPGGGGSHDILCDALTDSASAIVENSAPSLQLGAGAPLYIIGKSSGARFCVLTAHFNGAQSFIRLNGEQILSGNAGTDSRDGLTIGSAAEGRSAGIDLIACLMPSNVADVSLCEQYLATLLP